MDQIIKWTIYTYIIFFKTEDVWVGQLGHTSSKILIIHVLVSQENSRFQERAPDIIDIPFCKRTKIGRLSLPILA